MYCLTCVLIHLNYLCTYLCRLIFVFSISNDVYIFTVTYVYIFMYVYTDEQPRPKALVAKKRMSHLATRIRNTFSLSDMKHETGSA